MMIKRVPHTAAVGDPAGLGLALAVARELHHARTARPGTGPRRLPARPAPGLRPPPYRTKLIHSGAARNVRG
ncbi:hypothetical protein ABZV24_09440 [Streptomyces sp. NPDC005251]|uniref:hypothetical protein n=1 Tax=Streptomyces sp. NPDC005251 TaxID=3157166 RepID=UPI0033AAC69A